MTENYALLGGSIKIDPTDFDASERAANERRQQADQVEDPAGEPDETPRPD